MVSEAAKRDEFCASQDSLRRMMDAYGSFGLCLKACFCHYQPICCHCLLLVVVCGGARCGCGCGGGSYVRLFVCSCFHVFAWWVLGAVPLCRCVVLSRVASSSLSCGVFVVVCRCVSLSVRVRCEILGLAEKTKYRGSICQRCTH